MEQLPSPPPFLEPPQPAAITAQPRPGQLTLKWSRLFWVGWLLVAGSFAAIWYSSRLIGLSTWWLGPETEPRVIVVNVLPFTVPLSLSVAGFQRRRSLECNNYKPFPRSLQYRKISWS